MRASVDDFAIDAKGQSHLSTSALFDTVAMSEDDFVVHSVNREELEREVARREKVGDEEDVRAAWLEAAVNRYVERVEMKRKLEQEISRREEILTEIDQSKHETDRLRESLP